MCGAGLVPPPPRPPTGPAAVPPSRLPGRGAMAVPNPTASGSPCTWGQPPVRTAGGRRRRGGAGLSPPTQPGAPQKAAASPPSAGGAAAGERKSCFGTSCHLQFFSVAPQDSPSPTSRTSRKLFPHQLPPGKWHGEHPYKRQTERAKHKIRNSPICPIKLVLLIR
ncbi:nascent polypeptide-associated complex subunit alpha, muscle-specific form-like [Pezoporus flaviventris]|uniref:nascent polypeptide-associated complex subunit alpha, muscle-specific form-like n=1 Tax=Pezoporus flaviventris TaxID=889875 RepID=UPI002AB2429C|nr:nascent polypeptide-associated complex subunit alpha, muscle-specific form-like [Pezoporus flaviventris]